MNYFNYYTEIEDTFIRRRGKHLLLSPMDWAMIESWRQMGVPLFVALRGIEQSFDSYEARPRKRSVKSLLYCQEEVEAQFAEWLESQRGAAVGAGASESGGKFDEGGAHLNEDGRAAEETNGKLPFPREAILSHLSECRASLGRILVESRAGVSAEFGEVLERTASRLEELEKDFARAARPDAERLEEDLTALEGLLDRALRESLAARDLAARRVAAEAQLSSYKGRMERAVYEQTLDNLLAKLLREERGVPRLSLFYL